MEDVILTLTEGAVAQIKKIQEDDEELREQAIRVGISSRKATGFEYQLEFCDLDDKTEHDTIWEQDGVTLYVDAQSGPDLKGTSIDYVDQGFTAGFKFENPNKPELLKNPIAARVWQVLEEKINPGVAAHGGFVSLLDVKEGTAYVELGGGCQGCGQADVTVKQGVEAAIKEDVPEIHTVLDTTDHAAGENPYFRA